MRRKSESESARERILTDVELRKIWLAAGAAGLFGHLVKFLLLTAARRREAAGTTWDEVADGLWTLPAARNKTNKELTRPLSAAALAVLEARPRIAGCPYIFSPAGRRPLTAFSDRKKEFDIAAGVTGWRIHDLRRTSRSLLSRAGVSPDHAERCLGHSVGGVRGIYDRHRYLEEMRQAYEALAGLIERLLDPRPNVVAMRRGE
jgi:integrase